MDGAIAIERGLAVPTSRETNKYAHKLSGLRKPDMFEVAFKPLAAFLETAKGLIDKPESELFV